MSEFKVGDRVRHPHAKIYGKIISVDAYGSHPVVTSWEDGEITAHYKDTMDIVVVKEPRVVWVQFNAQGEPEAFNNQIDSPILKIFPSQARIKFIEVIEEA